MDLSCFEVPENQPILYTSKDIHKGREVDGEGKRLF